MSSITIPAAGAAVPTVGIALDGAGWHPAAWREPSARPDALFTADYWQQLVDTAEAAGADYVTFEDALRLQSAPMLGGAADATADAGIDPTIVEGRLDALLTASWIAPRTRTIGLIPTVTTTHTEPFHVATALQTLDHVSAGRAGWQLRFSAESVSADAFGRRAAPQIDVERVLAGEADAGLTELLDDAHDAAEVARRLWDSWEDDAIIRDLESGRFLDRDRVHHINFESERFSVVGPSIVPRSPQGQIVVTLLAHAAPIYGLAARVADVVFITPENDAPNAGASRGKGTAEIVAEVRAAEAEADRAAAGLAPLRIIADLVVALDTTEELAVDRIARLDDAAGAAFASDARIEAGSAAQIADRIAEWHSAGIDGVRLRPAALPLDLDLIAAELLPLLRERGLAGVAAAGSLRDRFDLGNAVNRHTAARTASEHAEEAAA
ncbi:LLM class flavin-dependent oxidoreductase [Leucobacter musarum]|uniref:LLM class flavin-dependent oxidoreductase n=1 Tax=Leucobacter musarum TaxID=1930747 RepID=UPI0006A7C5EE|nr:LLM class flavin-dependent oxidoreductase [Leucobacter musarum]